MTSGSMVWPPGCCGGLGLGGGAATRGTCLLQLMPGVVFLQGRAAAWRITLPAAA